VGSSFGQPEDSGRDRVGEPKSKEKPFVISKWLVWEAYQRVKANQGAPGVDECSIEDFEADLGNNLYRVWNRMSSGSYFPPPMKAVEIPKPHGGTRILGVPTVADRVAQTVVAMELEKRMEPMFHPDSYGYRPNRSALDAWGHAENAVGNTTGWLIWTSKNSSTASIMISWSKRWRRTPTSRGWCCM